MQIFIDAEGNATIVTPQHIYQGSNISQVNVISLAFTPQTTLQIAFVLPDGTTTNYYPMSFEYSSSTTNYYEYVIQQAFTALSGQASLALLATDSTTKQQTSQLIPFTIEPSVLPTLPDTPSQDEWTTLLQYVQQNSTNIANIQAIISDIENIANTANTNASQALSTANQALSTAQQAEETANGYAESIAQANTNASQAVETANQANQTAEQALEQVVEKQGTVVSVGGEYVATLDFDSDPQTQITQNAANILTNTADIAINKADIATNTTDIENIKLGDTNVRTVISKVYNGIIGTSTAYMQIGTFKTYTSTTEVQATLRISGNIVINLIDIKQFDFIINAIFPPSTTLCPPIVIQLGNAPEYISQVIVDGQNIILYLNNSQFTLNNANITVNYDYCNSNITPAITILSDYTPSESAVIFTSNTTGFQVDDLSATTIDANAVNVGGNPVCVLPNTFNFNTGTSGSLTLTTGWYILKSYNFQSSPFYFGGSQVRTPAYYDYGTVGGVTYWQIEANGTVNVYSNSNQDSSGATIYWYKL